MSQASSTAARTRSPSRSRTARTRAAARRPAGFIARLKADSTTLDTSSAWKTSTTGPDGWQQPAFDDTAWTPARELATYGSGPWGGNVSLPPQPSPYLRKDFTATKQIQEARLYVSALGMYEVHINGAKVGDAVLAPGWTEYSKRVPSQTYDVTGLVKQGDNAIGAILGDGWYSTRLQGGKKWGTNPALLAQLRITYTDGTTHQDHHRQHAGRRAAAACRPPASTTARPTTPASTSPAGTSRASRRLAERGRAQRDDGGRAQPGAADQGHRHAQPPKTVTQPTPGTYIYDLGQNFAGWARIKVTGAAGTKVRLRFGEILNADGTLYTANLRSAQQTDTYTLKGGGHGDLRAALHLPRLPLRRGDRRATSTRLEGRVGHHRPARSTARSPAQQRARQPDPERDPLGPALELPRRAERRLASATSASAGPATSRRSPPPARSTATPPATSASGCRRCATARAPTAPSPTSRPSPAAARAPPAGATRARSCPGRSTAATATRASCTPTTTR